MAEQILLVCKPPLETLPPVMSAALTLRGLGYAVSAVTSSVAGVTREYLQDRGVGVVELDDRKDSRRGALGKGLRWVRFHYQISRYLKAGEPCPLLWIGSADTAISMGPSLLKRSYILQIHELYDRLPFYRSALRPFARRARCVVVPEATRADIYRYWYDLPSPPVVVPNKFAESELTPRAPVRDATARELLEGVIGTGKIVLYQGLITPERDIRPLAAAVSELGPPWRFVAMGRDLGFVPEVARVCPDLIHIPFVDPPLHLDVTSHAHVGLLTYTPSSLNHLFCAPNKVWEFAGMGVPMVCDDIPALRAQVGAAGAGICVDFANRSAVIDALLKIDRLYGDYRARAQELYHSVSIPQLIARAVDKARGSHVEQPALTETPAWMQ